MSNKNPFEIRADILQMAKEYMDRQYEINMTFAQQGFQLALEAGKVAHTDWESFAPKQYDISELMKKAQEIYSFVSPTETAKPVTKKRLLKEGE